MATTTQDLIRDAVISALDEAIDNNKNITGEFLAQKFADSGSIKQAEFFNALANIVKQWEVSHVFQWRYMQENLTADGKALLNDMKDHTD